MMVQIKTEIEKKVAENAVSKIVGQPTNQGIDLLKEELLAIAASITMPLGGGNNGHAGILMNDADYKATFGVATFSLLHQTLVFILPNLSQPDLERSAKPNTKKRLKSMRPILGWGRGSKV